MTLMADLRGTDADGGVGDHLAHNYHPLDVVVERGEGVVLTDVTAPNISTFLPRTRRPTSATGTRR